MRTASEIPIEMDLMDKDAVPVYMKISATVLLLLGMGMAYTSIAERLGINLWMAKRAARWGKIHQKAKKNPFRYGDSGIELWASAAA